MNEERDELDEWLEKVEPDKTPLYMLATIDIHERMLLFGNKPASLFVKILLYIKIYLKNRFGIYIKPMMVEYERR